MRCAARALWRKRQGGSSPAAEPCGCARAAFAVVLSRCACGANGEDMFRVVAEASPGFGGEGDDPPIANGRIAGLLFFPQRLFLGRGHIPWRKGEPESERRGVPNSDIEVEPLKFGEADDLRV